MSLHIHHLKGCAPTPLAWYLKGLGILRLVAEQKKDSAARGWWKDEGFFLATILSQEELEKFFLNEYAPTPLVAPWNKGSGFVFAPNNPALALIEVTRSSRFSPFRTGISAGRELVGALADADNAVRELKEKTKVKKGMTSQQKAEAVKLKDDPEFKRQLSEADRRFKEIKEGFIPLCRRRWNGPHQEWMNAALVVTGDNEAKFPALLGTGGNDGKNDYTKQFMACLEGLFDLPSAESSAKPESRLLLEGALWGRGVRGLTNQIPVGQYLPSGVGGANSTTGPDGDGFSNPWDFVLMLEGAILFSASVTKKAATSTTGMASAPFTTRSSASGYASASKTDEESRGEQWMPLWGNPSTLGDIKKLFADGRAQLKTSSVGRPVDFARAVARLGVSRGVTAFQRYGYIERNGQSNLAVPLGRWVVAEQMHQELLNDLDIWLNHFQRSARDKNAPSGFVTAHRHLEEAILGVCSHGKEALRWQALLLALSEAEHRMVSSPSFTAKQRLQPIPPLGEGWIKACDDGSPIFRLALACALQAADVNGSDSIRCHWLPMDSKSHGRFAADAAGLRKDPRVVCHGLDPWKDCEAMIRRRLIEGASGKNRFPLMAFPNNFTAGLDDIGLLLAGEIDLDLVCDLARPLMALKRNNLRRVRPATNASASEVSDLYALFRLALLPWPLKKGTGEIVIRVDPTIFSRLASGDVSSAGKIAIRRLTANGLVPKLRAVAGNPFLARLLVASLAFPISSSTAVKLAEKIIHNFTKE